MGLVFNMLQFYLFIYFFNLIENVKNPKVDNFKRNYITINVLKTGPDRPVQTVQPSTGHVSGPIHSIEPLGY